MAVVTAAPAVAFSDDLLLARFAEGDRAALEELFQRYRGLAYRVAHRLLGNDADALDAVQEGFIKALLHLEGFQHRSTFKTWLLRVVSNASLDLGRQRGRREAQSLEALSHSEREGQEPLTLEDPGLGLHRRDLRQAIDRALAQLPEAQKQTFVLHAEAELSYREVAEALGISIGTVMSRLYYARQKLRAYLDPWMKR
jgi:RNA polymerase sigma-70 factor (ECF subfamily)